MEINKEYLEKLVGKEILNFKVGVTKNKITEVKYTPKTEQEGELMLYVNNETMEEIIKETESLKFTVNKLNNITMDILTRPESYFPKLSK